MSTPSPSHLKHHLHHRQASHPKTETPRNKSTPFHDQTTQTAEPRERGLDCRMNTNTNQPRPPGKGFLCMRRPGKGGGGDPGCGWSDRPRAIMRRRRSPVPALVHVFRGEGADNHEMGWAWLGFGRGVAFMCFLVVVVVVRLAGQVGMQVLWPGNDILIINYCNLFWVSIPSSGIYKPRWRLYEAPTRLAASVSVSPTLSVHVQPSQGGRLNVP
ncbi:hypothetical protein QBC39DRAFT_150727 [Podospora conica]|nr:hypothetical protein QBC39DRAFT_150727 [Schizothecium conicum]